MVMLGDYNLMFKFQQYGATKCRQFCTEDSITLMNTVSKTLKITTNLYDKITLLEKFNFVILQMQRVKQ